MDTIEYMDGQQQFRKDPDETVCMHRLILTDIPMQYEFVYLFSKVNKNTSQTESLSYSWNTI